MSKIIINKISKVSITFYVVQNRQRIIVVSGRDAVDNIINTGKVVGIVTNSRLEFRRLNI
jgi:hypothetical protein